MSIKVPCKNCGVLAPAEDFKLHHKYRLMVCPNCYTGKTEQLKQKAAAQEKAPTRPPGWDKEDEYLERLSVMRRQENQSQFSKISGTDLVKCACSNCKYAFKYDPSKKQPKTCPYCDAPVPKLRTYNLV
ncbi:hypothetical protein HYU22_03895 [Candidatus Woesearchaeota archaeon]|nr:hypothetical protein [Candidatus Woesearchaeota archaeon]